MKRLLHIFLYVISLHTSFGQIAGGVPNIKGVPPTTPSPNAASLGMYGQIPISLFNGLPNINIPLYNHSLININLSYHPLTVKPEHHSGWTGLGWNLNAGGSITRIVNGGVDEIMVSNHTNKEVFSYYSNPKILDRSNWYSKQNMNYYYKNTDMIHTKDDEHIPYPYPDEFVFNFNGISGSFYYNHKGKWVVKSNQPIHLQIKEFVKKDYKLDIKLGENDYSNSYMKNLKRIFYGFEITDQNGIKYVFGKTQNSIEFSFMGFKSDEYNSNYVANTWHLTKIISPNNEKISFEYDRDNSPVFTQSVSTRINYINTGSQQQKISNPKAYSLNGFFTSYLKKIKFKHGEILFNKSLSNELEYDFRNIHQIIGNDLNTEFLRRYIQSYKDSLHWYKLDNIKIKNSFGDKIEEIKFRYTQNSNTRLFLKSLDKFGRANTAVKKYSFKYNPVQLPLYNSQKIDHWGFYNGINFFENNPPDNNYFYSKDQYNTYYNSRNPNFNYAKAGVLEEISYPTGGKTHFIYEPNTYSHLIEKSLGVNFNVRPVGSNKITGGLRIKEIISNAKSSLDPPVSKKYYYVKDYKNNNLTSSGVLAGVPDYMEDGPTLDRAVDYWFWNSYSIEPMCFTNGNHVTYSKVIEKNPDGSFKEFTFSNHDNRTYRDSQPNAVITYNNEQWKYFPFNNKSLERGKLLGEKLYNRNKKIIREIKNTYVNIPDSEDNSIRCLYINSRQFGKTTSRGPFTSFSGVFFGHNVGAFNIYKYYNYLSKTETIGYNEDGSHVISFVEEYTRNNYRQLSDKSYLDSNNKKLLNRYLYVSDIPKPWPQPANNALYQRLMQYMDYHNMSSYPIEETNFIDNKVVSSKLYTYDFFHSNIEVSSISSLKEPSNDLFEQAHFPNSSNVAPFKVDSNYQLNLTYHDYDDKGNPIDVGKSGGSRILYVWGYNKSYPIIKIEGVSTSYKSIDDKLKQLRGVNFTTLQRLSNEDTNLVTEQNLRNSYKSLYTVLKSLYPTAQLTTYTYDPLIGVTSITDPRQETIYYAYDDFNRLEYVKDSNKNILKEYKYNYKKQ